MAFREKKPSLTGHSASHTHRPNTCQEIKKHTRATSRHPSAEGVIWICCWTRTASRCATSVFLLFSAKTKKAACSHETIHLEATLLEIPSFEDQFCHASTSPTRLGMRRTGEPPTCSQCGARGSNTGKNTPRSSEVQKKGSSTRLPCPLRRSSGNIYNFIDVPHSARVSIMFEPEAPASRVQRPRCTVPDALLVAMRTSCKTQGQMIVCTQSCLCLGCNSCGYFVREHDCFPTCQKIMELVTAETECAKKKNTPLGTARKDLESQRSRPPALPPCGPLCSVSAIFACGVQTRHPQRQLTARAHAAKILDHCVCSSYFSLRFCCKSFASHPLLVQDVSAVASAAPC